MSLLTSKSEAGDIVDFVVLDDFSVSLLKNGMILASIKNPFSHLITSQQSEFRAGNAAGPKARDVSIYCYVVLRGESTAVRFYDLLNLKSEAPNLSGTDFQKLPGKSQFRQKIVESEQQIERLLNSAFQNDGILLRKNLAVFRGFV